MTEELLTSQAAPKPWGVWATIGFSIIIFLTFLTVQFFALGIYAYLQLQGNPGSSYMDVLNELAGDGIGVSISLIPGALFGSLLVLLFSSIKDNISVSNYLQLNKPGIKPLLHWILILLFFSIALEGLNYLLDRPIPEWMVTSYLTAGNIPLFWFTLIIAAPVFEELLFRGFLLEGLRWSPLKDFGAVFVTAAIWAVVHMQYELFEIATIFAIGIILGFARIRTGSLYTTIILHSLMNLAATLQIAYITSQQ